MGNSGVELKIGSEINEFTIKKVLGSGTFGITYLAKDNYLHKQVVIKEYFPNDIAIRNSDDTISAKTSSDKENFEYGLSSFLKEAQVLAKFNHPNVVRVNSFCESNNTAYFIMDYEKGKDLEEYLKDKPQLNEKEILNIIMPLLDGLEEVHNKSYLHRDIKPGNIYIKDNNSPLLIDFGATRYSIGVKSKSLSIILTPGYAPKEQYSSKSKQAAYTDIYAIGAVMYKMVTDATPIEASERANAITDDEPDPHIKLSEMNYPNYSDSFKEAIDWALEFKSKDRPQSVTALKDAFNNKLKSSKKQKMENSGVALPKGSRLLEYEIIRELGAGTFGVTYLATDTHLERKVVIKEYFPNDIAIRDGHTKSIVPKSRGNNEYFEYGLDSFLKEAKVLARFNHPNIVKISRLFEENGTAYFVMDYDEGEDLQSYLSRYNSLSEKEILSIIMPILDGLREVHNANFLHRDIKPGNIYIRENSSPMLIGFDASRMAMGIKSKSLSVVLTEGYAPKEQYSSTFKQDAYTDLYSIGAVMYKMATGNTPPEASARADAITDDEDDPLVKLQDRGDLDYSSDFKKAVDWALSFKGKDRPQSVIEFQRALDSTQVTKKTNSPKPILEKAKKINNSIENSTLLNDVPKEKTNYYLNAIKKYFIFNGRATRPEYWYFTLFNTIFIIIIFFLDVANNEVNRMDAPILTIIYSIFIIIPSLSILVRRLHDIGKSAWWLLLIIIPLGVYVLLIFAMFKSDEDNKYGLKPIK